MTEKAIARLDQEYKSGKYDVHATAMKESVCNVLKDFCRQDEEFAQAVVQGGSFEECMKAVAKGCGSCLSDEAAYARAVAFYFPTGKHVRAKWELVDDSEEQNSGVLLNLADFW